MLEIYFCYFISFIIALFIAIKLYLRIAHPFWSIQPVYHFYDYHYAMYSPSIINPNLPSLNKFVNILDIHIFNINSLSKCDKTNICDFLTKNYLHSNDIHYIPEENHVFAPLSCNRSSSYISIYKHLKGIISARPLNIKIKDDSKYIKYKLYYVDNLCVDSVYRKKGIAQQLIQTLYYNLRFINKNISVFLFKREGNLTAISPLVLYKTYLYRIPNDIILEQKQYNLIEVNKNNIVYFYDFIKKHSIKYEIFVFPDLESILSCIDNNYFSFYMLTLDNIIYGIYGLKNSYTHYKSSLIIESFISLVDESNISNEDFIWGYWKCLSLFNKNISAKYILIETIGDNIKINNNFNISSITETPYAYFLYNYIYPPCSPDKAMIII